MQIQQLSSVILSTYKKKKKSPPLGIAKDLKSSFRRQCCEGQVDHLYCRRTDLSDNNGK